jgi:hypothetical protein
LRIEREKDKIERIEFVGLKLHFGRDAQVVSWMVEINQLLHIALNINVSDNARWFRINNQTIVKQPLVGIRSGIQIQRLRAKSNRNIVVVIRLVPNVKQHGKDEVVCMNMIYEK